MKRKNVFSSSRGRSNNGWDGTTLGDDDQGADDDDDEKSFATV